MIDNQALAATHFSPDKMYCFHLCLFTMPNKVELLNDLLFAAWFLLVILTSYFINTFTIFALKSVNELLIICAVVPLRFCRTTENNLCYQPS